MLDTTRRALFLLGMLLLAVAVFFELASARILAGPVGEAPGIGIAYLAFLDLTLLYTLGIFAADFVAPLRAVLGRVQGIVTFVLSLLGLLAAVALIFAALALLVLMLTLIATVPWGTLAYFAAWGRFDTGTARALLAIVMDLKLAGAALALVAQPALLKNKGLMLLLGCSIGATFLLGLLHALVPGFLVSITDAVGALVAGVIAAVWFLVFLIGAVPAVVRAVRSLAPG